MNNRLIVTNRLLISMAVAGFGVAALVGTWSRAAEVQLLVLALLTLVVVAALTHPHWLMSSAAFGIGLATFAIVMLAGKTPLGTWRDVVQAFVLLGLTSAGGWGLSRHLRKVEETLRRQAALIDELSTYDPDTGTVRASHFQPLIDYEVARARRYQHSFSLAAVELMITAQWDTAGDPETAAELDSSLAQLILRTLRASDRVGRGPAGELLLLLPHTGFKSAQSLARRLVQLTGEELHVRIAIGIATFPDDGADSPALLVEARAALDFAQLNSIPVVSRALLDI